MSGGTPERVECPACKKQYPWLQKIAGKKVLCVCGTKLRMPTEADGVVVILAVSTTQPPPPAAPPRPAASPAARSVTASRAPTSAPTAAPTSAPKAAPAARTPPPPKAEDDNIDLMAAIAPKAKPKPPPAGKKNQAEEDAAEFELNLDHVEAPRRKPTVTRSDGFVSPQVEHANALALSEPPPGEGVECPSCDKRYHDSAKICIPCGIDIHTGRAFITSNPGDLEEIYTNADRIFWWVSWPLVLGLLPFATEAVGGRKRYAVWTITAVTIIVSLWFYGLEVTGSPVMREAKNLMLWSGHQPTDPNEIIDAFHTMGSQSMGDERAFREKLDEVRARQPKKPVAKPGAPGAKPGAAGAKPAAKPAPKPSADEDEDDDAESRGPNDIVADETVVTAYNELSSSEKPLGDFHVTQLVTHALLHAGFWHLAGNLLFFLVFGLAVNGLIGNIGVAVIYPFLAIVAGLAHYIDQSAGVTSPMLGASGAIMGIAGMYFVFFPVHKVHVSVFVRPWPTVFLFFFVSIFLIRYVVYAFKLYMKLFACRGFWILLFYIAFDIYSTLKGSHDGTAHWAHLGGFIAGMAVAMILVATRGVNCRGGDLFTVVLGKHAWPIIGKPSQWAEKGTDEGWLQRIKLPSRGRIR